MRPLEIILILLIILFVGGVVAWQVVKRVRRKKGKSSGAACGCSGRPGCSGCAESGCCPSSAASVTSGTKYYSDDLDEAMPEITVRSEVVCDFSDVIAKINGGEKNSSDIEKDVTDVK